MDTLDQSVISEVYEIIMHMSEEDRNQIPEKAMRFLKTNRRKDYYSAIDFTKSLSEQKIKKDVIALLSVFYLMGFCKTEQEKAEFLKVLKQNEQKGE